jgi:alpha,alpha-trehalose phosphorylase
MGGTWMAIVYGFAGMRDYDGRVSFRPRLPRKQLESVSFRLTIRGQLLEVAIDRESASYTLLVGDGLTIWHEDEEIALTPDAPAQSRAHD